MKKGYLIAAACLVIAGIGGGTVIAINNTKTSATADVAATDTFKLGDKTLTFKPDSDFIASEYNKNVTFSVYTDGTWDYYIGSQSEVRMIMPEKLGDPVTDMEAFSNELIAEVDPDFDYSKVETSVSSDEVGSTYDVTVNIDDEKVNIASISFDNNKVFCASNFNLDAADASVAVSKDKAIELAKASVSDKLTVNDSATTVATTAIDGSLYRMVTLSGTPDDNGFNSGYTVYVNAVSGEVWMTGEMK